MRILLAMLVACGGSAKPAPPPPVAAKPPPPPPTCEAVGKHVRELVQPNDDHARRIGEIFALRCAMDSWSPETRFCVVGTTALDERRGCKAKLSQVQREALDGDLDEAERVRAAKQLPPPCEQYKQVILRLATCDKIPQQSRDALEQGFDAMESAFGNIQDMPAEAREAMENACKQGVEALQQLTSMCGF